MNNQLIEKRLSNIFGAILEVHSIFNTIQGEGPFAGRQAVFVRLAGCNLQCPACDTDYTEGRWKAMPLQILEFVREMKDAPSLVVITGGEPFRQNIHLLVEILLAEGYTVQVETNGTLPPPTREFAGLCSTNVTEPHRCFVVCSPKTGKVNSEIAAIACAYKYVMAHDSVDPDDGLPVLALGHGAHPCVARPNIGFTGVTYLQPCDSKNDAENKLNLMACMKSVMQHGYSLQLQIHKIIGVE